MQGKEVLKNAAKKAVELSQDITKNEVTVRVAKVQEIGCDYAACLEKCHNGNFNLVKITK